MKERSYILKFRSPASVFSGLAVAGLVDRMIIRDHHGLPIIPGSSVKGRWRFFAERLARSKPDNIMDSIKIHKDGESHCKAMDKACTICRLFGNPTLTGLLWVGDAVLDGETAEYFSNLLGRNTNPVIHPDAEIRPGVALSRHRRAALAGHLFFDETVPPVTFTGRVMIHEAELKEDEEQFLIISARLVDRIGGRKSVGRGILDKGIGVPSGGEE